MRLRGCAASRRDATASEPNAAAAKIPSTKSSERRDDRRPLSLLSLEDSIFFEGLQHGPARRDGVNPLDHGPPAREFKYLQAGSARLLLQIFTFASTK